MKSKREVSDGESAKVNYFMIETEDFWRASSMKASWDSGWLTYDKRMKRYSAGYHESKIILPKLGSGNYSTPDESPLDEYGRPKADFLKLLALREQFQFESPGRRYDPLGWRKRAIDSSVAERERQSGRPLPQKNRENAQKIAESLSMFERYVGGWLASVAEESNAGHVFRRIAKWMDAIDRLEEIGIPKEYQRFFSAVENAAELAGGVPTQKQVRIAFEAGLSANQRGQDTTFRSLLRKLRFTWLPSGQRGPGKIQKKSGI